MGVVHKAIATGYRTGQPRTRVVHHLGRAETDA